MLGYPSKPRAAGTVSKTDASGSPYLNNQMRLDVLVTRLPFNTPETIRLIDPFSGSGGLLFSYDF